MFDEFCISWLDAIHHIQENLYTSNYKEYIVTVYISFYNHETLWDIPQYREFCFWYIVQA